MYICRLRTSIILAESEGRASFLERERERDREYLNIVATPLQQHSE